MNRLRFSLVIAAVLAFTPLLGGYTGGGCAISSRTAAPDVAATWDVTYDDALDVELDVGGSVYHATLPPGGGTATFHHAGYTLSFDLDCARPEIVCPSEAWPTHVDASMRDPAYPHRLWVTIPQQTCSGTLSTPAPGACGEGTTNPDCERVCSGPIQTQNVDTFGVIAEDGRSFDLLLGGGVATNGINCGMLGISVAHSSLTTTGTSGQPDWTAVSMPDGRVTTAYGGACMFVGDTSTDGTLSALVVGATIKFTTGFTASRRATPGSI